VIERPNNIERLAVLEQQFKHLDDQVDAMSRKVTEMHEILLQARGLRIVFILLGTAAAGMIGAVSHWFLGKFG